MRGIISGDRFVRTGRWLSGQAPLGHDLQAKTLGIVGMGAIGTAVARRASASGMTIVYTNRRPAAATPVPAQFLALTDLLARADCVVILAPLTAATHGMMNAEAFAQMKRGAYFINAARGPLVDSGALYEALVSGQLGGAAVDVVDPEPLPSEHPLLALPNFFITPHIGTATYETRKAMVRLMVANAVAGVRGEPLPAAVP
jgi:glyoxylate reductase